MMGKFMRAYSNGALNRSNNRRRSGARQWLAPLFFAGAFIATGFIYGSHQHFEALRTNYRIEEMKRERDRLQEEKRVLQLKRESIRSPQTIDQAARQLGLIEGRSASSDLNSKDFRQRRGGRARTQLNE